MDSSTNFDLSMGLFNFLKVDLLKNELGFDEAFNYKEEEDLAAALKRSVFSFDFHYELAMEMKRENNKKVSALVLRILFQEYFHF